MTRAPVVVVIVLASLAGCGQRFDLGFLESRGTQSYFSTRMCVFVVDSKTKQARLRIELAVKTPLPAGGFIEMQFENPAAPGAPFVTTRSVTGQESTLEMVSPPLKDLRVRAYETVALVYSSSDKKELLDTHVQTCQSPFDQRDLGPEFR